MKKQLVVFILFGLLLIVSCQSIETLEREHKLVSGSVFLSESSINPEINHPVRIYRYLGEYFHDEDEIQLQESDTSLVASTFTGLNGRFSIALPTGEFYVLQSSHDGNESFAFFMHDDVNDDLNIYFQGGATLINIIDTPPTRQIPTYGEPPRAN